MQAARQPVLGPTPDLALCTTLCFNPSLWFIPRFQGLKMTAHNISRNDGIAGFYRGFGTVVFGTIPARMVSALYALLSVLPTTCECNALLIITYSGLGWVGGRVGV